MSAHLAVCASGSGVFLFICLLEELGQTLSLRPGCRVPPAAHHLLGVMRRGKKDAKETDQCLSGWKNKQEARAKSCDVSLNFDLPRCSCSQSPSAPSGFWRIHGGCLQIAFPRALRRLLPMIRRNRSSFHLPDKHLPRGK